MIHFAHPGFLWLLGILPILAFWKGKFGAAPAVEYSSTEIVSLVSKKRKQNAGKFLATLRLFAIGLCIIALARPQWGRSTTEEESNGIDLMLAMDVSGSMEAMDFKLYGKPTSRLDVVKTVVAQFVEERSNDRIGVVAFAGRPYLVSPLTLDHDWLQQNMDRVQIGLVEDRTAIGSAIATAVNRLKNQPSKSKVVILLTDGVNNAGKISPLIAADSARAMGVRIYTIGAGAQGEAPMPIIDAFGQKRFVMMPVEMDEETLKKIADTTGGKFFRATDTDSLKRIYGEIDQMEKTTYRAKRFDNYKEIFAWALIPGLLILGGEILLGVTYLRRLP
ncbi:MAG: vWA domain-containing protein [Verrucomicrobiota bacterium]